MWTELLQTGLSEDGVQWDWTSLGTAHQKKAKAQIVAKETGVWAASGLISAVNECTDQIKIFSSLSDGDRVKKGSLVCSWSGSATAVLAYERTFLNLASYASGIATATCVLVDLVKKACPHRTPRVTPTRKILPHYRALAIHGVMAGGGFSHRVNLAGGVLIKENHIAVAGGIAAAVAGCRAVAPHGLKIEVEVRNLDELGEALKARADGVLLDNFVPNDVRAAVKVAEKAALRPVIEVSGGLSVETISSYAIEGVDILSVGGLTHSVRALDLSMIFEGV